LSGNSLKIVASGAGFASASTAKESIQTIRAAVKDKFLLPNLSYDEDPAIGTASTITTGADGKQTKA
jgi:hypothetical protein